MFCVFVKKSWQNFITWICKLDHQYVSMSLVPTGPRMVDHILLLIQQYSFLYLSLGISLHIRPLWAQEKGLGPYHRKPCGVCYVHVGNWGISTKAICWASVDSSMFVNSVHRTGWCQGLSYWLANPYKYTACDFRGIPWRSSLCVVEHCHRGTKIHRTFMVV